MFEQIANQVAINIAHFNTAGGKHGICGALRLAGYGLCLRKSRNSREPAVLDGLLQLELTAEHAETAEKIIAVFSARHASHSVQAGQVAMLP